MSFLINEWERIIVHFQKEFTFLKTLFRFYALQGTEGSEAVESMGKNNFASYAQEIAVTEKRSLNLNAGSIDLIFIRSNQDRAEGVDYFDRNNMGKALRAQKGARGTDPIDNKMGLREFVCANVRLAHAKHRMGVVPSAEEGAAQKTLIPSLADRWERYWAENVQKYVS